MRKQRPRQAALGFQLADFWKGNGLSRRLRLHAADMRLPLNLFDRV
jgi:hypothetical protein